ncbi:cuticle protein 14-like [Ixodes scapularis]|uniref:cuticle protein 14-like n=1 Tax=Ixodes scapularis TaxID=6945 RepID=UPI001C3855AC|nr:cuticle protein 14-like [Ixodes scapularis]
MAPDIPRPFTLFKLTHVETESNKSDDKRGGASSGPGIKWELPRGAVSGSTRIPWNHVCTAILNVECLFEQISVICGLVAVATAGVVGPYGGFSRQHRKQDDFGRYNNFGYNIVNGLGATNSRYESGSAYGPVVGSYTLADIDGRARRVEYVADKLGFRAVVKTNEPGTKTSLAAAAPYISAKGPVVPSAGYGYGAFPFAGGFRGYGGFGGFHG